MVPEAVIYSAQSLSLDVPEVTETRCADPDAAYRFRYTGLRLVRQAGNQYVLLPANWSRESGTTVLIARSATIRLEFRPAGQPSPAAADRVVFPNYPASRVRSRVAAREPGGQEGSDMATGHDIAIVGAGSAGCVLAARLTEDPACRVCCSRRGPTTRPRACRPIWPTASTAPAPRPTTGG